MNGSPRSSSGPGGGGGGGGRYFDVELEAARRRRFSRMKKTSLSSCCNSVGEAAGHHHHHGGYETDSLRSKDSARSKVTDANFALRRLMDDLGSFNLVYVHFNKVYTVQAFWDTSHISDDKCLIC